MKHFRAPWGTALVVTSALASLLCAGITVLVWLPFARADLAYFAFWLRLLPLALLVSGPLFMIRRYTITPDTLIIQRLLWQTRISLAELESAEVDPQAMRGSIRLFGNGGLFSFTGYYRNKRLGTYRAFVTDLKRAVILRFRRRTLVVSPVDPEAFVSELARR